MLLKFFTSQKPTLATSKQGIASFLWPLLGSIGVLLLVVSSIIILSLGRNETNMVRLLLGEGSALIYAVEGSVRMSMRQKSPVQLQRTLQELVNSDVRFVSILMPDGTIIAHNDVTRLGSVLRVDNKELNEKLLKNISQWQEHSDLRWFIAQVDGRETFVVYREFTPVQPPKNHASTRGAKEKQKTRVSRQDDFHKNTIEPPHMRPAPPQGVRPLIFLGLDIGPFEASKKQDRIYLFSLAFGVTLLGAALLLVLYYAQRAQESRRRQFVAEGQVRVLEEEMRRKEKMAAIGNLAAGVAHEIRNPLSSIKGYATYFGQRFPEGSEDREAAGVMVREVERLNRVITDLIGLSRPTDVQAKPTDILPVLEHSLRLLRPDAEKKQIQLILQRPKRPLPLVLLDVDRFGQALLNICLNAMEAMPEGGEVTLSAKVHEKASQDFLLLEIKDTGLGIAKQHIAHIFDPYFTTKGQGTGLGLATVHKIVEAHGGEISVSSRQQGDASTNTLLLGKAFGTQVRILLPLAQEKGSL